MMQERRIRQGAQLYFSVVRRVYPEKRSGQDISLASWYFPTEIQVDRHRPLLGFSITIEVDLQS